MKLAQFETVIGKDDIDAFMGYFGFEFPEEDSKPDYLDDEWYNAEIIESKDKFVIDTARAFSNLLYVFIGDYNNWLYKYRNLYQLSVDLKIAKIELDNADSKLKKPFNSYKYKMVWGYNDKRYREYSHKLAGEVWRLTQQIDNLETEIQNTLSISDELPQPTDDIFLAYERYNYCVTAEQQRNDINNMITTLRKQGSEDVRKRQMGLKKPIKRGKLG